MGGDGPTIETGRLLLRIPQAGDFERFAELHADEEAARWIGGHMPRAAAWRKFLQQPGAWAIQGFGMFSIIERDSGLWLGQAGPWRPDGWPGDEVGYMLHPDAWGRGYVSEALPVIIDWVLDDLGWEGFIHCIAPENQASKKVAERLGSSFREFGKLPPPYEETVCEVWSQARTQWQESRKRFK